MLLLMLLLFLHLSPVQLCCPTCKAPVQTIVTYVFGTCAIVTVIVFFIVFWCVPSPRGHAASRH